VQIYSNLDNVEIGKCENVKMNVTNECCLILTLPHFPIFTLSFPIFALKNPSCLRRKGFHQFTRYFSGVYEKT